MSIYDFKDYKKFLGQRLKHGGRSALAKAIDCQGAYVSRVLNDDAHFSLEQADKITAYLNLPPGEAHYFMLLLQYQRAGTRSLRQYFRKQLDQEIQKRTDLKRRVEAESKITEHDRYVYYSSWLYSAVHILTSIPAYQNREKIAEHLQVELAEIDRILEFLLGCGLVREERGKYVLNSASLHLERSSPLVSKHHYNWRTRGLHAIDRNQRENLHYSLVFSLANSDVEKIKLLLAEAIENTNRILRPSKEERIQALCIDFFRV